MTADLQSLHNDIAMLKKMVAALMKDQSTKGMNRYHVIGGYVYGQTGNNDPFVILYPIQEYLTEKICRVYPQDFKKLPSFINTKDVPGDTDENPDKGKAMKRGIYHECPAFGIATYPGKMTQMGPEVRFSDVLWVSSKGQTYQQEPQKDQAEEAPATPQPNIRPNGKASTPPPPPAVQSGPKLISPDNAVAIHSAGIQIYGVNEWTRKITDAAGWASKGSAKKIEDLTVSEGATLLTRFRKAIAKGEREGK